MLFLLIDYHYLSSCQLIYQPRVLCDNDICIKNMYICTLMTKFTNMSSIYMYQSIHHVIYTNTDKQVSKHLHQKFMSKTANDFCYFIEYITCGCFFFLIVYFCPFNQLECSQDRPQRCRAQLLFSAKPVVCCVYLNRRKQITRGTVGSYCSN